MIGSAIQFIIYAFLFFPLGFWALYGLQRKQSYVLPDLFLALVLGMITHTALSLILSILMPLQTEAFLISAGSCLIGWAFLLKKRNTFSIAFEIPRYGLAVGVGVLGFVLVGVMMKAAAFTTAYDHGLYYAQFIRWTEQYGVVAGLANMHHRFGFNSSWHVLQALTSFSWLDLPGDYDALNEFYFIIVALFPLSFLYLPKQSQTERIQIVLVALLNLGLSIKGNMHYLSHPTPDAAIALSIQLMGILFGMWLLKKKNNPYTLMDTALLLSTLTFFIATTKLSGLLYGLIPVSFLVMVLFKKTYSTYRKKLLIINSLLFFTLFVPQTLRGYVLSGYPFFPLTYFDVGLPFAVPKTVAQTEREFIMHFARKGPVDRYIARYHPKAGEVPEQDKYQIYKKSPWLAKWIRSKTSSLWSLVIFGSFFLSVLWFTYKVFKQSGRAYPSLLYLFLAALFVAFLIWFFKAPSLRFIKGNIYAWLILLVIEIVKNKSTVKSLEKYQRKLYPLCLSLILALSLVSTYLLRDKFAVTKYHTFPAAYFEPKTQTYTLNDQVFHYPVQVIHNADGTLGGKRSQCWDATLPCDMDSIPNFRMRGEHLKDGFLPKKKK